MGHNITKRDEHGRIAKGCGGRPAGTKNKYTVSVLDAVLGVFSDLGGESGLRTWAAQNPRNKAMFYSWVMKLLPQNIKVDNVKPIEIVIKREIKRDGECE